VNDFWTADVKSLYTMTNCSAVGNTDPPIKLIELSVASADADGTFYGAGGENIALSMFAVASAKSGYWYNALVSDAGTPTPDGTYRQDTSGLVAMGAVHNTWRFGFTCWPDSAATGKFIYILDESNTIYRSAVTASIRPTPSVPPGPAAAPYDQFPDSNGLKASWSKLD
jgi:hypothetical protein